VDIVPLHWQAKMQRALVVACTHSALSTSDLPRSSGLLMYLTSGTGCSCKHDESPTE
jgi:hypothetical protein